MRQEIIATLGRLDVLQESGQLDRLLRSGLAIAARSKFSTLMPPERPSRRP